MQHSYVDAHGNFGPCDFIDKTYGNLLEEDVKTVWTRLRSATHGPHCLCLAKHCRAYQELPDFYRLMKGR